MLWTSKRKGQQQQWAYRPRRRRAWLTALSLPPFLCCPALERQRRLLLAPAPRPPGQQCQPWMLCPLGKLCHLLETVVPLTGLARQGACGPWGGRHGPGRMAGGTRANQDTAVCWKRRVFEGGGCAVPGAGGNDGSPSAEQRGPGGAWRGSLCPCSGTWHSLPSLSCRAGTGCCGFGLWARV